MSEIRELLAAAQQAEIHRDFPEAVRLLKAAAEWYSTRDLGPRADQMLRQVARLEGRSNDDFGFGDELFEGPHPSPAPGRGDDRASGERAHLPVRGPLRAEAGQDAWCSFCCRPDREVGALVTGPTGSFICLGCAETSTRILADGSQPRRSTPPRAWLPSQQRALLRITARAARLALIVGPPGAGKSALMGALGEPARPPYASLPHDGRLTVDLSARLAGEEEARLLAWLEGARGRALVVAAPGSLPPPLLVLVGTQGDEAVYDTGTLAQAVEVLSARFLGEVDQIVALPAPDAAALASLAGSLLAEREIELPPEGLESLVQLALGSGRGAHELVSLVRRIAPGRYSAR